MIMFLSFQLSRQPPLWSQSRHRDIITTDHQAVVVRPVATSRVASSPVDSPRADSPQADTLQVDTLPVGHRRSARVVSTNPSALALKPLRDRTQIPSCWNKFDKSCCARRAKTRAPNPRAAILVPRPASMEHHPASTELPPLLSTEPHPTVTKAAWLESISRASVRPLRQRNSTSRALSNLEDSADTPADHRPAPARSTVPRSKSLLRNNHEGD